MHATLFEIGQCCLLDTKDACLINMLLILVSISATSLSCARCVKPKLTFQLYMSEPHSQFASQCMLLLSFYYLSKGKCMVRPFIAGVLPFQEGSYWKANTQFSNRYESQDSSKIYSAGKNQLR